MAHPQLLVALVCVCALAQSGLSARQPGLLPGRTRITETDRASEDDGTTSPLIEPTSSRRAPADFEDGDDPLSVRSHWALLIAGSAGWWNYRHQADVSHAYQVLRSGGFLPQHMVLMMYDDIAENDENPFSGHIFNKPGGPDVYAGLRHSIDYRGSDVNAENFLAVLGGDAKAMRNIGSGRVIQSGRSDRLFVFYSDHGAAGVLGMPTGNFLYADDLISTVHRLHSKQGYKELVIYVEACESGSMFEGLLGEDLNAYVTTASNAVESSWGTYCPGMDPAPPPEMSTCLGDLYSVAWLENSEVNDLTTETLLTQYNQVLLRTSNNYTFDMGSHVMQYGALDIDVEKAGDYIGMKHTGQAAAAKAAFARSLLATSTWGQLRGASATATAAEAPSQQQPEPMLLPSNGHKHRAVEQRDADLVHLHQKVLHAKDAPAKLKAQAALGAEVGKRQGVDAAVREAAAHLLESEATADLLSTNLGWSPMRPLLLAAAGQGANGASTSAITAPWVELLVSDPMGRPAKGVPLVDSWQCLKDMVAAWEEQCGRMDDYSMRHTRFLANLCNAGINARGLRGALGAAPSCRSAAVASSGAGSSNVAQVVAVI